MPARGARASVPGERVRPGEIALTVIPKGPSSLACLINFETLTDQQKQNLKREIQHRERTLQMELSDVNRALSIVAQKSRRKKSKRKKSRRKTI